MAKIDMTVDVEEAVAEQLAKQERKIEAQGKKIDKLTDENARLTETMSKMKKAKDALLEAADWLDPFRYEDD
jgi:predicted nuclease with TOPRIM domain